MTVKGVKPKAKPKLNARPKLDTKPQKPKVSHDERRERRRAIAEAVAAGQAADAVAVKFGVSVGWVFDCAREHGVTQARVKGSTFAVLADLQNTWDTWKTIAERHRMAEANVQRIYKQSVKNGIRFERSSAKTFAVLADLQNTRNTWKTIAERHSMTEDAVRRIYLDCLTVGVRFERANLTKRKESKA